MRDKNGKTNRLGIRIPRVCNVNFAGGNVYSYRVRESGLGRSRLPSNGCWERLGQG